MWGINKMKYKVTDSENKQYYYNSDEELLTMLNYQFDLMKFEKVE